MKRKWSKGKYRWRTNLRGRLPWLAWAFPKGSKDCGSHDEYLAVKSPGGGAKVYRCYHCEPHSRLDVTTVNAERHRIRAHEHRRSTA